MTIPDDCVFSRQYVQMDAPASLSGQINEYRRGLDHPIDDEVAASFVTARGREGACH